MVGGNVNQHVCIIRTKLKKLNPHYLSLILLSSVGRNQIDSFQAGGNREGLNFGQIRSFVIPKPNNYEEQKIIAEVLFDVDRLLASLETLIIKKRNIKIATMQQLLTGKTRLPEFSGEWGSKSLGQLLEYEQPTKYLVKDSEYSDNNDIPVLTAGKTFILGYTK